MGCCNSLPLEQNITPNDIITFWYGELNSFDDEVPVSTVKKQMTPNKAFDDEIRNKFGHLIDDVLNKRFNEYFNDDKWGNDTNGFGLLSLLIITDQWTRNIFRGKKESFQYDSLTHKLLLRAKDTNYMETLFKKNPIYANIFIIAWGHFEDIESAKISIQYMEKTIKLFESMGKTNHPSHKMSQTLYNDKNSPPWKHYDMIEKFGRFLQRDGILGRETNEDELKYLEASGMKMLIHQDNDGY